MVSAEFYNQQQSHVAANAARQSLVDIGRWLRVSPVTAALIALSLFNAMHGPVYDCVRAGAYYLRSRRGPIVAVMQVESLERITGITRWIPVLTLSLKESIHVDD